jgi:hypothetical protein
VHEPRIGLRANESDDDAKNGVNPKPHWQVGLLWLEIRYSEIWVVWHSEWMRENEWKTKMNRTSMILLRYSSSIPWKFSFMKVLLNCKVSWKLEI